MSQSSDEPVKKNCRACRYSYMEPDDTMLICGHPEEGTFGKYLRTMPLPSCPDFKRFEQHPHRKPNGDLGA